MLFPKANLYYQAQRYLTKYKIKIISNNIHENFFSLDLQKSTVAYEGIKVGKISKVHILLLGVYNDIDINDIMLSGIAKNFLPQKINKVSLHYSVLHPLEVKATLNGGFGYAKCFYKFRKNSLIVQLHPSKLMKAHYKSSLYQFKKLKNGVYRYATSL